jgi:hypothetical protein
MNKRYFYLIGFVIVILLNVVMRKYADPNYSDDLNQINLFKVIENALRPVGIFLLVSFFFKKDYKVSQFAIFILVMIIVESTFRYFNGKSLLDYNYLIGMILGLIPVYLIDLFKQKNVA